jgi:hypothetical protein
LASWIESNILLQLASAPFDKQDETLVPEANFQIFFRTSVSSASLRSETSLLIFLNFFLTIPITSYTITSPASLRSDHLIGINRNADRHRAGTLIDFPGIRTNLRPCLGNLVARGTAPHFAPTACIRGLLASTGRSEGRYRK